jgi:hypothetical protein
MTTDVEETEQNVHAQFHQPAADFGMRLSGGRHHRRVRFAGEILQGG